MYVSLSFSKLNFFISLLGMVLLATKSMKSSEDTLIWLQGMILALTLIHFCLLAASHFSTTTCRTSLVWRLLLLTTTLLKLATISYAIYLTISNENSAPAFYLDISALLTTVLFVYEARRTCLFIKRRNA